MEMVKLGNYDFLILDEPTPSTKMKEKEAFARKIIRTGHLCVTWQSKNEQSW